MAIDGQNSDNGKTGENGRNKAGSESGENQRLEAIRSRYLQCPTTKRLSDAQRKW